MSIKITNRYDSNEIIQDSANYPEFSGSLLKEFLEFLVKRNANLSGANLSRANLSRANLSGANLSGANLSDAYLSDAYLSRANLSDAYLSRSYLSGSNLSGSNLSRANLSDAYLSDAYLSRAYLSDAYLSGSNLSGANLSGANLSRANLSRANLSGANLSDANLSGVDLTPFCKWSVRFTLPFTIHIGCKSKTIKEWDIWFKSDETFATARDSQQFKMIYANYLAVKSYIKEYHKQKLFHEVEVERNGIKQKEWQVNQ